MSDIRDEKTLDEVIDETEVIETESNDSIPVTLEKQDDNKSDIENTEITETTEKNKSNEKDSTKTMMKVMGVMMAVMMVLIIILAVKVLSPSDNNELGNRSVNSTEVNGETVPGKLIENKERKKKLDIVNSAFTALEGKNIMINVADSSSSGVTMMYNSHGEAIAESPDTGYKTFYMNDHSTVRFSGSIEYGYDSEVLSLMRIALDMAMEDKDIPVLISEGLTVTAENSSEIISEDGAVELCIDIRGWENIEKLYSKINEDFAQLMIDQLKSSISLASQQTSAIKADDELNLRIVYIVAEDDVIAGACYVYIGDKESDEVTWNDLDYNWVFQSYLEVYDWKLDEGWYNINWVDMDLWTDESEEVAKIEELFINQYQQILDMMNEFATDNGMDGLVYDIGTSASGLVDEATNNTDETTENNESEAD